MGLTRIRAEQISDIDYKQAVRVITLTDITLSGGAPAEVDGVSLVAGDRVLVNGQSDAAQNGLYRVQTVGAGSNGTWVRTTDGNEDGEIQPGMVVMVTQGTQYADTPWKLTTNGEIEIGVTELTFEENYSLAFGNIFVNGTAVIANVVSAAITFEAGNNVSITGNNTTKTVTIAATGGGGSGTAIVNGDSNVDIATANADITMSVAGTSNVVVVSATGMTVQGNVVGNGIATTTVSSTPPANAEQGDIWIDSDSAIQYIYFSDGNSSQWAEMEASVSFSSGGGGGSVDFENIASNVLPSANVTYNLGSPDRRWNDLWLANSTIHIGAANISATGGNLELPATVSIGTVTLAESGGNLSLPAGTDIGGSPAASLGKAIAISLVFGG